MLIEVKKLKHLPVASMQDEAQIGQVDQVLIHPETGELIGFLIKTGGWFSPKLALSSRDVTSYDYKGIVVRNQDSLVAIDEIQPFKSLLNRKDFWLDKEVITESGDKLGKVNNLIIDTDLEQLAKIHVGSTFGKELILDKAKIVEVTPRVVKVKDLANTNQAAIPEQALA
ncbi:PRC-barrel domain-containing protein [Candidatus Berkelbacteria bacterium]|nr:PRC-barrel domain-containing protein [Candidatus Berkelbacteria bacterium]